MSEPRTAGDTADLLKKLQVSVRELLAHRAIEQPLLIGVPTGGVWLAEWLQTELGLADAPAVMDVNFYRDDFGRGGLHPRIGVSAMPESVEDRHVLLVDDVLHSGRTIRAALNAVFDYGRPASVMLAVLVDRSGRQLPIQADAIGGAMTLTDSQRLRLRRNEAGLQLQLEDREP